MQPSVASSSETADPFADLLGRTRRRIDGEIEAFLAAKRRETEATAPEAAVLVDTLSRLMTSGGKRLRPALVCHAYEACGGRPLETVLPLALATEFLHAYLLVHDDIMDHAELRRGQPTAHAHFRQRHRERRWRGDAADFGRSIGILVGDLAASYAFELFAQVPVDAPGWRRVERVFATTCQEVIHGQYLEILASFREQPGEEELRRVLQLKSGRYTVERPIQLGAVLAGASEPQLAALCRYGSAVGEAFQLQDDVLGMFGDAAAVGKPVGSDLTEGKFTFLVYYALKAAGPADRAFLQSVRGKADATPEEEARGRAVIEASGALARVRRMVAERLETARRELEGLDLDADGHLFFAGLVEHLRGRQR